MTCQLILNMNIFARIWALLIYHQIPKVIPSHIDVANILQIFIQFYNLGEQFVKLRKFEIFDQNIINRIRSKFGIK